MRPPSAESRVQHETFGLNLRWLRLRPARPLAVGSVRADFDERMKLRSAELSGREAGRTPLPDEPLKTPMVQERFTGVAYALDRKPGN
jgi:hypothetical protein